MKSKRTKGTVLTGWLGLVGFAVLAGVLATVLVLPAVLVPGRAMGAGASLFENLPDYITIGRLTQQNEIYANRDGKAVLIATVYDQDREVVDWTDISDFLKDAVVAGEDQRFFSDGGVDMKSIIRAAIGNITSKKITSGSSTIEMQYVKNILIQRAIQLPTDAARKAAYAAAISDTLSRKLREAKLAVGLDKRYTKKQILAGYLNIVGFGGNTYGVEAAARKYFSVDAASVTLAQAASLIAIVQQPSLQNLSDPSMYPANKLRRDEILAAMLGQDYINQADYAKALATPIADEVKRGGTSSGCLYATDAKYACDYVTRLVPTLTALGNSAEERITNWAKGGYKLFTSIDLNQQDVATAALRSSAPATEARFALGAAADSLQPGTGRILIMAQNKYFDNSASGGAAGSTAVNFSTDKAYGGSSGFQTGSTYKVFTLTDWLQNGHGLNEYVNGSVRTFQQSSFAASCSKPFVGTYKPRNDSPNEGGYMSVLRATQNSVNVAFMSMAQQLDLCDIRDDAKSMGVHRADGTPLVVSPASVLGVNEIAPLSMAGAIATIGAGGIHCTPTIVDRIEGPTGDKLAGQAKQCTQAMTPSVANAVAYALATVMTGGTGTHGNPHDGVPLVGKTGTTDTADQNWLIGTTTKVALAVWVGNISGHQDLRRITVAGTNGYNTKFNIFRKTIASLNTVPEYRGDAFPDPAASLLAGNRVSVPTVTGQSTDGAKRVITSLGLRYSDGGSIASSLPAGQVARTDPAGGALVPKQSLVTVYTSDGSQSLKMPHEAGRKVHQAEQDLTDLGLDSAAQHIVWVSSNAKQQCVVIKSDPAAGSTISPDSQVTLTVGNGRPTAGTDPGSACAS